MEEVNELERLLHILVSPVEVDHTHVIVPVLGFAPGELVTTHQGADMVLGSNVGAGHPDHPRTRVFIVL